MEVEMNVSIHHQQQQQQEDLSSQTLESMLQGCTKAQEDKKQRPAEAALKCPRCDSGNTKFCYYNNYSLTQPRYFCKSCRRYWTKGGTLRNVPVGGGCRKNKRSSSATSSATSSNSPSYSARGPQQHPLNFITPNCSNNPLLSGLPHLPYDSTCTDLSLAFARLQNQPNGPNGSMGYDQFDHHLGPNGDQLGFLDQAVRGEFLETTTNTNRFHNNLVYNGGNLGNGDMGSVGNLMGLTNVSSNHDQEHSMTPVKQEGCNMMRSSEGGFWGFPWQMGAGGAEPVTMVHEIDSGRSMIGGWNGIGSTNWHGLINSPLM